MHYCRVCRKVLRDENCLSLLLSQLRSPSLTIVSNACGTLWNFSARSTTDQELLWELGAVPMLQSLTNSKHKTISTCSLAALKNLYTARPQGLFMMVSGAAGQTGQLTARKVKNMVADLDEKLSDCGGKDVEGGTPQDSPDGSDNDLSGSEAEDKDGGQVRSDSQNSLSSNHSRASQHSEGRKALFLKGITDVAKQNGTSMDSLGKSLPSCYNQPPQSSSSSKRPDQGRSSLSAEGRYDSHYTSYMKKPSPEFKVPSLEMYLEKDKDRSERVMSPSNLMMSEAANLDSPSNTPLDLSKKKHNYEDQPSGSEDTEPCEEKPTDYSLRYQESETDVDKEETEEKPLFDDHVKTYYTEGTPMDTPFMFSTATSMNDLREPAIAEEDEQREAMKSQEADTTVAYAVEGTPMVFSRAESLSDLEDLESCDNKVANMSSIPETSAKEEKAMTETAGEKNGGSKTPPLPSKDASKTVTFSGPGAVATHLPHETPMMFSRASSCASLDSFDQHSVNDDYSSYEASRATSGRVSPSHLPDSPSQTMPGTPRQPPKEAKAKSAGPPPLAALHKKPMFEDGVKSYQVEGTPAILSTRTSLSGLEFEEDEIVIGGAEDGETKSSNVSNITDEDDDDIYADSESLLGQLINSAMPNSKPSKSKLPKPKQAWNKNLSDDTTQHKIEEEAGSDDSCCSADNDDILDACIASAMPSKPKDNACMRVKALGPRLAAEGAPADGKKTKKMTGVVSSSKVPPPPPERKGSHLSHPCVAAAAAALGEVRLSSGVVPRDQFRTRDTFAPTDQPRAYRVEDTPLNFSAATSLSDLTVDDPDLKSGRISVDSEARVTRVTGSSGARVQSVPASGADTPLRYMTEDTPAVFSRNDSLSSLEFEETSSTTQPSHKGRSKCFLTTTFLSVNFN